MSNSLAIGLDINNTGTIFVLKKNGVVVDRYFNKFRVDVISNESKGAVFEMFTDYVEKNNISTSQDVVVGCSFYSPVLFTFLKDKICQENLFRIETPEAYLFPFTRSNALLNKTILGVSFGAGIRFAFFDGVNIFSEKKYFGMELNKKERTINGIGLINNQEIAFFEGDAKISPENIANIKAVYEISQTLAKPLSVMFNYFHPQAIVFNGFLPCSEDCFKFIWCLLKNCLYLNCDGFDDSLPVKAKFNAPEFGAVAAADLALFKRNNLN